MIRFIKPILKFFVKSNAVKSLVISLLEDYSASTETNIAVKSLVIGLLQDYADSTETDIDNEIVALVKEKLWPVT